MSDDSRKLFYSIGEVADIFRVNESTLRFWEKEFPAVIKPKKNAKGTRFYTKDDIENIRTVHFLVKEKGMTLAGARKKLREDKKGINAQQELAERLRRIRAELLKLQNELGKPAEEPAETATEPIAKVLHFVSPEQPASEPVKQEPLPDALETEETPETEAPIVEILDVETPIVEVPDAEAAVEVAEQPSIDQGKPADNWSGELF